MKDLNLNDLTEEQLEELLAERRRKKQENERLAKESYEYHRDLLVNELTDEAEKIHLQLVEFKAKSIIRLEQFRTAAKKYGDIRGNSKGGFGLRSKDGNRKVALERNVKSEYDERAALAETLLKEFLEDKVLKKDKQTYRTITALMTRNKKTGDYNPTSINSLISIEDNYTDERWIKAIKLFKESFRVVDVSMSVGFYKKDEQGKDESIPLSFSSL
jgi:hypothetical protein